MPTFVEDGELVLKQGETRELKLWLLNSGSSPVEELWVVTGDEQEVWLGVEKDDLASKLSSSLLQHCAEWRYPSIVQDRDIEVN